MSTQFNYQKHFYFKLFKQLYITIRFRVSTVSMSKTVQFQTIQFSISTQFKCKYSLIGKTFLFQAIQFSQPVLIQLSISTGCLHTVNIQYSSLVNNSVLCKYDFNVKKQIIQFNISTQYKCKYGLIVKNISISSHSV